MPYSVSTHKIATCKSCNEQQHTIILCPIKLLHMPDHYENTMTLYLCINVSTETESKFTHNYFERISLVNKCVIGSKCTGKLSELDRDKTTNINFGSFPFRRFVAANCQELIGW